MASPADILKAYRGDRSRAEIAAITGIKVGQLANYENGYSVPTSAGVFAKLRKAYPSLTFDELHQSDEKPIPQPVGRPKGSGMKPVAPEFHLVLAGVVSAGPGVVEEFAPGTVLAVSEEYPVGSVGYVVRGDSMEDEHIDDGDIIIVRREPVAERGEKVVLYHPDAGMVLKIKRGDHYASANKRRPRAPLRWVEGCYEYGTYIGVMRKDGGFRVPKLFKPKRGK